MSKMFSPRNLGKNIFNIFRMLNIFNMFQISLVRGFGSGDLAGGRLLKDLQNIIL